MQARGEEKSQGHRLLRAQEGGEEDVGRCSAEREHQRGDQDSARGLRILGALVRVLLACVGWVRWRMEINREATLPLRM